MSLVSTLARVAMGVALAKGVSHIARNGLPGSARAGSAPQQPGVGGRAGGAGSGLEGMMDEILGRGRGTGGSPAGGMAQAGSPRGSGMGTGGMSSGGMGSGGMGSGGMGSGGGIGDLLGGGLGSILSQLGGSRAPGRTGPAPGGLGDLLGSLTGRSGGGGIGGLLGGLVAGGAGSGGLGAILNRVAARADEPAAAQAPTIEHPAPEQEMAAAVMISAMVQAAKCDGTLDDAERERLMQHMGDADPAEVKFVNDLLAAPVDLDGLVRQVPRGMEEQVYLMSLMAIDVDSPAETDYLTRLAQALGIASDRVDDIHRTAGVPTLSA